MSKKDVIYIDIEDDITTIIDKVAKAKAPIVALVPPKRSTVLQSAVNMKLLKKAAEDGKKKLVLITSESTLMPIAGAVGLYVADNLQSRPEIPEAPEVSAADEAIIEEEPELDPNAAVGALAGASAGAAAAKEDTDKKEPKPTKAKPKKSAKKPAKADGVKIPNFQRFRNKLILLGVLLAVGVVGWYLAFVALPKATIDIAAQTVSVDGQATFTFDPAAEENNVDEAVLIGTTQTMTKNLSESFTATGKKNIGEKANGTITVTNNCFNPGTLPKGTSFTSNSGLEFVSTKAVTLDISAPDEGVCNNPSKADVSVRAVESGDKYNLAPIGYTVNGYSKSQVSGFGGQMSGGTNKIATVVTNKDIEDATNRLLDRNFSSEKQELIDDFGDDMFIIANTFVVKEGEPVANPKVDQEATEGTVSADFTFRLKGVEREPLNEILKKAEEGQIDISTQAILETGLDNASIKIVSRESGRMEIEISATGQAGPEIDTNALAEEITGKRFSEVQTIVLGKPGVKSAEIDFSPFWVFNAPRASRITINVAVTDQPDADNQ